MFLVLFLFACAGPNPNPGERTVDVSWHEGRYKDMLTVLKPRAEEGYPWAQLRYCSVHKFGLGIEKVPIEAVKWCKKASVQMADGEWANGKMIGASGNAGFFNQNSDALIAQYQLADFYFNGEGVKKDLITAYLYIKNVLKHTKGSSLFFCCEFAGGRYVTAQSISELNDKITQEMSEDQIREAEKQLQTWTPKPE
jgi:hypothetical protein